MRLGRIGIWSGAFRADAAEVPDAARELEDLGFGTLWLPGGAGGDVFGASSRLLTATGHVVVATGILNIWAHDPADVAASVRELGATFPDRLLLGLGVSHAPLVEHIGGVYDHPLEAMVTYLDALDRAPTPVAPAQRALADLIGLDTTQAVAQSLYEEFKEPLYAPPPLLSRMVEANLLGRKTGRGFYDYSR